MVSFLNIRGPISKVVTCLKLHQQLTVTIYLPEEYLFSQNTEFVAGRRAG